MTLFNSDCIKEMKLTTPNTVDHIIVDLPYFQVVKDEFDNQWNSENDYLEWVLNVLLEADKLLRPNGNIVLFCSRQYMHNIALFHNLPWKLQRTIIWARKRGFNNTRGHALASGYEPILHFVKDPGKGVFNNIKIKVDSNRPEYKTGTLKDGICLSDVWTDISALPHNSKEKVAHPTQKPLKLMERIVSLYTNEGDTVLDFCMGSGSTGVACTNLNRNFIGIEKDETYYQIAYKRIKEAYEKQSK